MNSDIEVVYFDTLEAMLMALNAGDIDFMRIYSTVADYLYERNENLIQLVVWDKSEKTDCSAVPVYKNLLQNDFAFMMLEGKEALREEYRTGPGGQLRPGHCSGQRRRGRCILDPRQYSSV